MSEESIIKISKSQHKKSVHQIDKNTGEIIKTWPSLNEVSKQLGIARVHIGNCCKGICKSAGGFVWRYID